MYQPPYFIKKFISTNRSRVKDPHFLAQKQPKMDIFEKADYLGLKDPLEVWVHYEICNTICGIPVPTILNHKKFNRVGRRGQKQPKWGIFGGTKIPPFWLFLAPPADPVEFLWFKMAGTGIPHIVLCFMLNSHL